MWITSGRTQEVIGKFWNAICTFVGALVQNDFFTWCEIQDPMSLEGFIIIFKLYVMNLLLPVEARPVSVD